MKTQLHNYMLNLFEENRCVFMSPMGSNPKSTPKGIENAESAEHALQIMTPDQAKEAGLTARDKISRLADKVKGNKTLHKRLVELDKKLSTAVDGINMKEKEQAKAIGNTILELNKVIDTKLPDVRKQILDSSIKVLGKVKSHGQKYLNSLVSAFSMMKVKDSYSKGKTKLTREGNKLFVNDMAYNFHSQNVAGKITWNVMQGKTAVSGLYDPIDHKTPMVKQVKTKTLKSKMDDGGTKPAPRPKKAVAKGSKDKVGKPKTKVETKEGPTKQLLSETFKIISNPDVHGQNLTPQQLSALKSFTKSVPKGGVKHFKHGNAETYIARSKDGAVWKISTIVKDSHGDTASGIKYYAPRARSSISHKVPKQYKGKVQFTDTPAFTIKTKSELAAGRKPKNLKKRYDTGEPKPDPKILAMFKNQARKAEQQAYLAKGMKKWVNGATKAVAAEVKRLGWLSKSKALAKDIQAETKMPFKKAADLAVKFKSRCENCDRKLATGKMTPAQVIAIIQGALKVLPDGVGASYASKFKIEAGRTRLASLGKGIPPSAIPKENLAKPKADTEKADNVKGYKNLAQTFKLNQININDWAGTGKDALELKLVFNIKGKSPVMKDKHGNEFYLKISEDKNKDTMSVHIKNKGEKKFKLAFNEVDGEMELPAVDITDSPKKTVKKNVKKGPEAYDKNMEKNVKTLMSKFNKLKPNGLGVNFKMKNGTSLSVFRKDKDTCYAVTENGEKASFSLKDGAEVRNIAQIIAKNPKFESAIPPKDAKAIAKALNISPREKVDIKESVGVLKKMLEGKNIRTVMKSNKQDLKDYLAHIGGVHKRKKTPGKYNIAKGYTLNVSKSGIVKLTHKGEGTLTYPRKNADA